jgi:hypothetical protein
MMSGRIACLVLLGGLVALAVPVHAIGASSISVAVDPPVVGARIAVSVTMASDDPGIKRA